MRRYHRYEVVGFDTLRTRAALLVGYHGRPIAHDLCILTTVMKERLGYLPLTIMHGAIAKMPFAHSAQRAIGMASGDGDEVESAIARNEHVLVTPGGTREGCRSSTTRHRIDWGKRTGYLRLALKYRVPIIPIGAFGVDNTYLGLNDGYRLGRALHVPGGLPLWLGVGPLGLWPLSPPFPAKFVQVIGDPLTLDELGLVGRMANDDAPLVRAHDVVTRAVQSLIDRARSLRFDSARVAWPEHAHDAREMRDSHATTKAAA
jgi:hypothetical protein